MAILRVDNLQKTFGAKTLFSDITFEVQPAEHVGLIGVNGSGKTTLISIILGTQSADSGMVSFASDTRISYVEQNPALDGSKDIYHFTLEAFRELIEIEEQMSRIADRIELGDGNLDKLIVRQDELINKFNRLGGNTYQARTRSALLGLGFTEEDLSRSILQFSGGQISKAALARAILRDSELLILDEPTNNLDIAAIRWLEEYLKQYKGAVLIVSHDRAFLDATVTKIVEISHGTSRWSQGNYTRYQELKMTDRELAQKRYMRQEKEIKRIEGIIEQQKRWNQERNYITIASKQKQIERIRAEMVPPEKEEKSVVFRFPEPKPSGNEIFVLKDLGKRYNKQVFSHLNLLVKKGECVCIIGENGCGKSTLLRILSKKEEQTEGILKIGEGIQIGYYAQHSRDLNDDKTVINEMYDSFPSMTPNELRGYLGMFLFRGDDIYKVIGNLSGGERARIQLLKLVLSGANVLLLDEPTNHLDIASAEVLEQAIERFTGTVVIVSHDRYLVTRLADRIILMDENGFTEQRDEQEDLFEKIRPPRKTQGNEVKNTDDNLYLKRKEKKAALLAAKQSIHKTEQEIERIETEYENCKKQMNDASEAGDFKQIDEICSKMTSLQERENELYEQLSEAETVLKRIETEEML